MLPKFELAPILMYLTMLPKDASALDDIVQDGQVFLEQDNICGFLGDIDRRVHGYCDIGGLQCRTNVISSPMKPTT